MMDGLALGETTPGPLIMVVTFVGFVGGYTHAVFGADMLFVGGAVAACMVTWFTFLPSFIFVLAGGPFIETTHNKAGFTAPLTAITAAVVGVIVNLGLFFIWHTVWPEGAKGGDRYPCRPDCRRRCVCAFQIKMEGYARYCHGGSRRADTPPDRAVSCVKRGRLSCP